MVDPSEEELEVFGLDVEPHVPEKVPELGLAEEALAFRVVLVEDRLSGRMRTQGLFQERLGSEISRHACRESLSWNGVVLFMGFCSFIDQPKQQRPHFPSYFRDHPKITNRLLSTDETLFPLPIHPSVTQESVPQRQSIHVS